MEAILIPIVAILLSIGGPVAIAIIAIVHGHREKIARYETVKRAVEAGRPPEEIEKMLSLTGSAPRRKNSLRTGIILVGIGLGVGAAGTLAGESPESLGGMAFLVLLGLAFILIWYFIDRRDKPANGN